MAVTPIRYPTPKPLPNPWHIPNTLGQSITTLNPGAPPAAPAPAPAAAPVPVAPAPPPPPPPPDFAKLTEADPTYIQGKADITRHTTDSVADLLRGYLGQSQSYSDNANAHGALFSGAATHAQNYAKDTYTTSADRLAAEGLSQTTQLYNATFNRLMQQLAGLNPAGA